jgi:signal transduction histidine kinase
VCEVTLDTDGDAPNASLGRRGTAALRIIGEALTNACRRAAAEHLGAHLEIRTDRRHDGAVAARRQPGVGTRL